MNEEIVINDNIPLDIYQTWFNKDLPQGMIKSINKLKQDNPDFTFHLFDDNECADFIKEHFGIKVSDTFDNLIPGAYKADLWRYCILYKKGGIYIDVKFHTNNFNLKQLTDKNYFVKDRDGHWEKNKIGIYNGFMISKPKNPIFLNCINDIIKNVNSGNMGLNSLYPTGPGLIGNYFKNTDKFLLHFSKNGRNIQYKDESILSMYENYRSEQIQYQKTPHYTTLWLKNFIYKNTFNKIKVDRQLLFDIILMKNIKTLIPSNIYQVYLDSVITEKVKNKSKYIQENAPNFGYFLFSLYDCAEFIRKHFDSKIYTAYIKLKHVKNKLDLWKYCILYKYGGIYIDLNYNLSKKFNISLYILKNFYLKDTDNFIIPDLIMSEKGNTKLLNCIEKIVTNVNTNNYGSDCSEVSNSKLITSEFNNSDLDNIELILKDNKVYHDNVVIINSIDEDYFTLKKSNLDSWETKKIY